MREWEARLLSPFEFRRLFRPAYTDKAISRCTASFLSSLSLLPFCLSLFVPTFSFNMFHLLVSAFKAAIREVISCSPNLVEAVYRPKCFTILDRLEEPTDQKSFTERSRIRWIKYKETKMSHWHRPADTTSTINTVLSFDLQQFLILCFNWAELTCTARSIQSNRISSCRWLVSFETNSPRDYILREIALHEYTHWLSCSNMIDAFMTSFLTTGPIRMPAYWNRKIEIFICREVQMSASTRNENEFRFYT